MWRMECLERNSIIGIYFMYYDYFCRAKYGSTKNKLYRDEEVLGYSEYMEYMAWENMMLLENPDYKDSKILIDVSENVFI